MSTTIFRFGMTVIAAVIVLSLTTMNSAMSGDLVQERQYLRVKVGGKDVRLEAVFVKRADAKGRLPIAFFNHGRPAHPEMALDHNLTADEPGINLLADIARRGWLVAAIHRRGFGQSD